LIAEVNGLAGHPVRHGDSDLFVLPINDRLAKLCPHIVWRSEVADIFRGELGIESGDEYRGTYHFGEPGRLVYQRIPGWSNIRGVKLQRLCAGDQRRRAWRWVRRRWRQFGCAAREMLSLGTSDHECQQECRYQCLHQIRSPGFGRARRRHEKAARWPP
jgi:hypothetical protein